MQNDEATVGVYAIVNHSFVR